MKYEILKQALESAINIEKKSRNKICEEFEKNESDRSRSHAKSFRQR